MKKKLLDKIAELELGPHAFKLGVEFKWPLEKIERVAFSYRCFLQAIYDNPGMPIVPSKEIDEFWHQHILDTEKYMEDCHNIFGRYLHHFPYSGLRGEEDARLQAERYRTSQELIDNIAAANP